MAVVLVLLLLLPVVAIAHDSTVPQELEPVVVSGERSTSASSQRFILDKEFEVRPQGRPADLLRLAPGLFVSQHQGGGKADQYLLRGFDADHGTDLGLFWDDVPINIRSHVHGQGYADAHFIIPETIKLLDVRKGPYYVEYGDFVTAGMVNVVTRDLVDENVIELAGGGFDTGRLLTMFSPTRHNARTLVAVEEYFTNGPFNNPNRYHRFNGFGKMTLNPSPDSELAITVSHYTGAWNASGQIPLREVLAGRLDRFEAIDPSEGGDTRRTMGNLRFHWDLSATSLVAAQAYVQAYRLHLFSNFTFFLNDSLNGDGIEQDDHRYIYGGDVSYQYGGEAFGIEGSAKIGVQTRVDDGVISLKRQRQRAQLRSITDVNVLESSYSPYLKLELQPVTLLRFIGGVRDDYFHYHLQDRLNPGVAGAFTGKIDDSRASLKGNLVFGPWHDTEVFLNAGSGFHSNDARVVIQNPTVQTLPKASAYEVGLRTRPVPRRVDLRVSLWVLDLTSELVFNADDATFDAKGATRRYGTEFSAFVRLGDAVSLLSDWTWSHAQFRGTGEAVPLAPVLTSRTDIIIRWRRTLESNLELRYLGDRPATGDRRVTAKGYIVIDWTTRYRYRRLGFFAAIENVLNAQWREAQFFFESQLRNEAAPAADIHFTPGVPRTFLLGVSLYF